MDFHDILSSPDAGNFSFLKMRIPLLMSYLKYEVSAFVPSGSTMEISAGFTVKVSN
ncbi:hypothetical protein SDC9_52386 [bioreactor metagenome]|uniref:Uncharacterized protein n=1 Tax=bioreactor metagenome TaxID=1076179 RepID=A0A644WQI9_9ZZZZ